MDSLKKYIIQKFSDIPFIDGLENNNVILATPSGIIIGTPIGDNETDNNLPLTPFVDAVVEAYRNEHSIPDGQRLKGNDGFLYLKDVTIQNGPQKTSLPFLCVFYDQIVGVSIGQANS